MEIVFLSLAALFVSVLTFFSGFGLGTILSPIFMLYFPIDLAIALTGIVHFFNNLFKLFLVGKYINKEVLLKFGIPAISFAVLGSWLLLNISDSKPILSYELFHKTFSIFPIKLIISILLILFATIELVPYFKNLEFSKNKLIIGGALSGFFGGLSGNQGALRSAFLIKGDLTKEEFISTAVIISTLVDITRLSMYSTQIDFNKLNNNYTIIFCTVIAGIIGAYLGNKLLKKVTLKSIQVFVALTLILFSIFLGTGIL
jgi:hypothetical protein